MNLMSKKHKRLALADIQSVLSRNRVTVFVDLAGRRRLGHVVKINQYTTWVKVMDGAKTYNIIKRHNKRHHISSPKLNPYRKDEPNAVIYSTPENQVKAG